MVFQQNISLKSFNTFGIDVPVEYFTRLNSIEELGAIATTTYKKRVLGSGSNVLLTRRVTGLVIHNELKGITKIKEDDDHVWLSVQSGEVWHDLVLYAIGNGWGGIENLALIPGTVGASPMQNIGAYGVEAKETIESVTYWDWDEKAFVTRTNEECNFGYRDSIFKQELQGKTFITSVVYKLAKRPVINTSYGAITQELEQMGVQIPTIKDVANAVIRIRTSKLPDPKVIGNAGSFFKNPTISRLQYTLLQSAYTEMPCYPVSETTVKVPAGWLIEQCGWKGYRHGDMGVHAKQALVLVNYGKADGSELWELSGEILHSVMEKFGIELEREVQVW
jgi:UDP-N-acetylmuramate dehydrogenase